MVFLYVAFVPYRNEKAGFYDRWMPVIHYGMTVFLLVVSPIFCIVLYLFLLLGGGESGIMFGYLTFNAVLSTIMLTWFFVSIIDDLFLLKIDHKTFVDLAAKQDKTGNKAK